MTAERPMLDWTTCPAVERRANKVSGAWVFRKTRVPVSALFSNLRAEPQSTNSWNGFPEYLATR